MDRESTEPEPCDHEWEYVDASQGDGVWFQSGGYEQCIKCDETREYEPPEFDDDVYLTGM